MKERGMSVDKLHFASEFTSAFQLIISLYNYSWRHSNCVSPAAAVLNKTNICTKLILTGNGKQLFCIGRWSIALQKHSKWLSATATAYQIVFYRTILRIRSLHFVNEKHRYGSQGTANLFFMKEKWNQAEGFSMRLYRLTKLNYKISSNEM